MNNLKGIIFIVYTLLVLVILKITCGKVKPSKHMSSLDQINSATFGESGTLYAVLKYYQRNSNAAKLLSTPGYNANSKVVVLTKENFKYIIHIEASEAFADHLQNVNIVDSWDIYSRVNIIDSDHENVNLMVVLPKEKNIPNGYENTPEFYNLASKST